MNVLSITQLNTLIGRTLEREYLLKNFYVQGTIVNAKRHSAGHYYFTLKDEESSIDAVMWSSTVMAKGLAKEIQNGLLVTVKASINFWSKAGRLNIVANDMQIGQKSPLQVEFEALKRELTALGYFEEDHKQAIPELSSCIGIVTSSSGAVLHDILHVSAQRNPLVKFKLFSVPVQGDKAGPVIAKGIQAADKDPDVDVIIVGRGGGSAEDLWPFNTRDVVEAIYKAKTPVVSAVGHETDYSLSDLAADMRGATPSHAAEMTVLPLSVMQERLSLKEEYLHNYVKNFLRQEKQSLAALFNRSLGMPALQLIHKQKTLLERYSQDMTQAMQAYVQEKKHELSLTGQRLEAANPMHIMLKGYSKVEKDGQMVTSVKQVAVGDSLDLRLTDGSVKTIIQEVENGRKH
ncbi:MAG: exodeoxyribonuclease VII large subunit [Veillonella sp.]|nr:exodeoxyribonuclease VII large subunit [Veillonella sp.]